MQGLQLGFGLAFAELGLPRILEKCVCSSELPLDHFHARHPLSLTVTS